MSISAKRRRQCFRALNKTFTGKVVRYSDQIDTNTRTMHTELQVPNPKYEIVPGMYADG